MGRDRDKADISPAPPRWAAGNAPLSTTAAHHLPPIHSRLFSIGLHFKMTIFCHSPTNETQLNKTSISNFSPHDTIIYKDFFYSKIYWPFWHFVISKEIWYVIFYSKNTLPKFSFFWKQGNCIIGGSKTLDHFLSPVLWIKPMSLIGQDSVVRYKEVIVSNMDNEE